MKRALIVAGIAVLAVSAVLGVMHRPTGGNVPKYRVAAVERGRLTATVSASGTVNAVVTVQVGSQLSGQVKAIHVDYNSTVRKGQVIALIGPETFDAKVGQARADVQNAEGAVLSQRALVQRARAEVENARGALAVAQAQTLKAEVAVVDAQRDLERKTTLLGRGLIARSDRDTAQALHDSSVAQVSAARAQERVAAAAIEAAQAQLEAAQAQLQSAIAAVQQRRAALTQAQVDVDNTLIRAPVDGVVVSRNVDVGQTVAASLQAPTLFTIAQDLTHMQVETSMLEADIGRVKMGQAATFTVDAFPGTKFKGSVVQIRRAPHVNQGVVTYDVIVSAANPELKLLPGMTANVKIVTDQRNDVLTIPVAALRVRAAGSEGGRDASAGDGKRAGGSGRVFVLTPAGEPKPVSVRLGLSDGNAVEVVSGELTEGQEVVVGTSERRPARSGASGVQVKL